MYYILLVFGVSVKLFLYNLVIRRVDNMIEYTLSEYKKKLLIERYIFSWG